MKKIISLIVLLSFPLIIYALDIEYFHGNAYVHNKLNTSLEKIEYSIKYSGDEETFFLVIPYSNNKNKIYLSENDLGVIRKIIEKYFEWESIAIENQVKIEKQIPNSKIKTGIIWQDEDKWYKSYNLLLDFTFVSRTKNIHQLVISTNTVKDLDNQHIENKIDTLYLYKEDIVLLYNILKVENIKNVINEYKQEEEIYKLFK